MGYGEINAIPFALGACEGFCGLLSGMDVVTGVFSARISPATTCKAS